VTGRGHAKFGGKKFMTDGAVTNGVNGSLEPSAEGCVDG
jgi:hypothetical protein